MQRCELPDNIRRIIDHCLQVLSQQSTANLIISNTEPLHLESILIGTGSIMLPSTRSAKQVGKFALINRGRYLSPAYVIQMAYLYDNAALLGAVRRCTGGVPNVGFFVCYVNKIN